MLQKVFSIENGTVSREQDLVWVTQFQDEMGNLTYSINLAVRNFPNVETETKIVRCCGKATTQNVTEQWNEQRMILTKDLNIKEFLPK